ncbi:MAG TPA: TonB-dependent receptor, partial [Ignavibacteriaceae bacterium]
MDGVNITIQSESLQGIKGIVTNNKGHFSIINLPVGNYNVKISFVGYRDVTVENVQIRLGKTTYLGEIKLEQQAISLPVVTISGEKYIIDPTSTTYGGNLTSKDVENLPIDRNYQSMISLLPQANLSYYGDGVNIGGSTGFENKYFVDGVEVTDPLFGVFSTYLPYNFINEIEVKAGGYEAEFQSALGGVVNVVTNSGTNEFHTSVFGFYTSNSFTSHKELGLLDPTQGDFSDYDVGFSLGGPIILDKLWFFAAYNPTYANHNVSIPGFGIGIDKTLRHSFAGKLNWLASQQLRINFTVTGDPTEREAVGRNVLNPPYALENPDVYLQDINEGGVNISMGGSYSFGQNILLEGSIARVIRHDTGEPSTEKGNDIRFDDWTTGTLAGGVGNRWDSYRYSNIARVAITIPHNTHLSSIGIQYKVNGTNNQYDYHSIIKYNDTTYAEYIGKGFQTVSQRMPSFFIQDSWKIFKDLRAFIGIRWDGQYIVGSNDKVEDAFVLSENRFRTGNPGRGILSDFPRPERNYKALIFIIEKHYDEHFNFQASYVLSKDYGNYEGLFDAFDHWEFPNINWSFDDLSNSWINATGLVPNDRTHVFKFSG